MELFGIHLLLNILLIYQILRVSKLQGKKDQINKDDLILFDEEQNICQNMTKFELKDILSVQC